MRRVEDYPQRLRNALGSVAPPSAGDPPTVVLLSPGPYNSAYFEHSFLARHMGVELVLGPDLFVRRRQGLHQDDAGPDRVDVIYRRVDDDFLDPKAFRPDSCSACRPDEGLPRRQRHAGQRRGHRCRRRQGHLSVRPRHDPLLPERGADPEQRADLHLRPHEDRAYVLDHLARAGRQGGQRIRRLRNAHGAVIDGQAARRVPRKVKANPRNYIAQPVVTLSTCRPGPRGPGPAARRPAAVRRQRHVDLGPSRRPDPDGPGQGSLVVNSSQGGGSKDTWVMENGR